METTAICKAALATVGVVRLIKNLIPKTLPKWLWSILTIIIGSGICVVQYLCPAWVMDAVITVSGATVFYDTIYKGFEKLFMKLFDKGGDNE